MKISDIPWLDTPILHDIEFSRTGHVLGCGKNRLVPVLNQEDLNVAGKNDEISGIIVSSNLILPDQTQKIAIIFHDPMEIAVRIRDDNKIISHQTPTQIHPSVQIHPTAIISEYDVFIDRNVRVLEYVRIEQGCIIGEGTVIGPNSHIGIAPIEHSVQPSGKVIIGKDVFIHALCIIERPVFSDNTIIGDWTHIDNRVFIHQGVEIGELSLITANTKVEEYAHIGRDCWIGLRTRIQRGVSIGNNCYVTLGSIISHNINDNMVVRDNWAVSRERFRGIIP